MDLATFAFRARTLLLYALCGGGGVVLDFILYGLLIHVGIYYQVANAIGYATGTLLSFTLNRVFTFKVFDNPVRRLVIFVAVAAAGLSVSWLVLRARCCSRCAPGSPPAGPPLPSSPGCR